MLFRITFISLLFSSAVSAQSLTQQQLEAEISGASPTPTALPTPDPAARINALGTLGDNGLLLIPESTNDRVMAFDPLTGNLLDPDFIPADPDNLSTPIHAILSSDGASVLVSDQLEDVVQQYDLASGNYLGVFAPVGGVDVGILDNVRGLSLAPNGNLLVSVGSGANADAIAEFDTAGNPVGNRVANGADGLGSPFDVLVRSDNLLVGGINSDIIHQYTIDGAPLMNLTAIDSFPEQLAETASGNILVANFTGTEQGVVEYSSSGALIGVYNPPNLGGYRGAYELPNGNILTTNGGGVHEIDRAGNLVETKLDGVSARFIELALPTANLPPPPAVPVLNANGMLLIILLLGLIAFITLRMRQQ